MRRTNLRFNNRVKVRNSMEERMIHLEKVNNILVRNAHIQDMINKELRGKHEGITKKLVRLQESVRDLIKSESDSDGDQEAKIVAISNRVSELVDKMDVMEEVLEDIA